MERINLFLLFIFIFLSLSLYEPVYAQMTSVQERDWRTGRKTIEVISYNIFNGFDYGRDNTRMDEFVEWVSTQSPDVLALQELCGFTEATLREFAARYGHNYVAIVKEEGYPVGITSREPMEVIEKRVKGYGHGMLHCRIYGLDFLVTHLNPSDWRTRKQEADNIIAYINEKSLTDCLLMGDLNAHSPFDAPILETHHAILRNLMRNDLQNKDGRKNLNNGNPEYSVISTFMAAGLHDVCRLYVDSEKRYTFPTRILIGTPKGKAKKMQEERIDYIFVTNHILPLCVEGFIFNGTDTDYLSDHYPIGVRLLINE